MSDLKSILKVLLGNDIDFVLVGGLAGVLHGSSMVTKDVDICLLLSAERVEKLRQILGPYNPTHRMTPNKLSFLKEPKDLSAIKNLYLATDLGVLDLLTDVKGVGNFERVKKGATKIDLFGYPCLVMGIEDLIASKVAMGRGKDIAAVKELRVILEKGKKL